MKPNPQDEIAGRAAEERSEDDGMAEHPAKARDPAGWAADRRKRTDGRIPAGGGPVRTAVSGIAAASGAVLAALASAGGALRRSGAKARAAGPPRRLS